MNFDLNINNYNFNEILQLFDLNVGTEISVENLRTAKSKVLSMHPDKSKLSSEYFIFYKRAFEFIFHYYQSQPTVKMNSIIDNNDIKYDTNCDTRRIKEIKKQLNKIDKTQFNKYFNDLYNANMIDNEQLKKREERNSWFTELSSQNSDVNAHKSTNVNTCIEEFKKIKTEEQICKYNGIQCDNHTFGSMIYDNDEENDSYIYCDPSSKLLFDDLRKVHKNESVFNIEVMSTEIEANHLNCDELRSQRFIDVNTKQTTEEMQEYSKCLDKKNIYNKKLILQKQNDVIKSEEYSKLNDRLISRFMRISN